MKQQMGFPKNFRMAKPGQYKTNKKITPKMANDIKPTKMERTGPRTAKVYLEDGGYMEVQSDDAKKLDQFQNTPKSYKSVSISGFGNGTLKPKVMSNEDRKRLGLPLDD